MWSIHVVCNDDCEMDGYASQEHICFRGFMVTGLTSGITHVNLEVVDGSFHDGPDFIQEIPFRETRWIPGNIRKFMFS